MRIGIAMFYHESHSFVPYKTAMPNFHDYGYYEKEELYKAFKNTKTELGGFISVLEQTNDVEIVPILCAAAIPSGVVTDEAYNTIEERMLQLLREAGPLDGLLLALHGAMVVESIQDPEEQLITKIKQQHEHLKIAVTLDMHANIHEQYTELTPIIIGYKTYPHVDMFETGVAAANLFLRQLAGQNFITKIKKLPLLLPSINMRTAEGPMHTMIEKAKVLENLDKIESVTVLGGFPYADVKHAGAGIIVIGTEEKAVDEAIEEVSNLLYSVKEEFIVSLPNPSEAVDLALQNLDRAPVVLADISDNPLSCGSGDTTILIEEVLKRKPERCLIGGIYDLESIEACKKAGIGSKVKIQLGGKIMPQYGQPLELEVEVVAISDGVFYNSGPYQQNYKMDLKAAVHVKYEQVDILLIGRPMSANDPEMFRHIGIEPTEKQLLVLKAKNHFRAAFEPLVGHIIYVDAPGAASNYLRNFDYQNVPKTLWPLNQEDY